MFNYSDKDFIDFIETAGPNDIYKHVDDSGITPVIFTFMIIADNNDNRIMVDEVMSKYSVIDGVNTYHSYHLFRDIDTIEARKQAEENTTESGLTWVKIPEIVGSVELWCDTKESEEYDPEYHHKTHDIIVNKIIEGNHESTSESIISSDYIKYYYKA